MAANDQTMPVWLSSRRVQPLRDAS